MNAATAFTKTESKTKPVVFVVDDDVSVRESLELLIAEAGWRAKLFVSAEEFLAHPPELVPGCIVLDVGLPALNGLELQQRLNDRRALPIIFITGRGDIPMSVQAMKAGAVEFLTKPFGPDVLLGAIQGAIERSRVSLAEDAELQVLRDRYESLTVRERQVMALVVRGQLNKLVAFELNLSEITVKVHRGRAMKKMAAGSVAELVNMAARLGLSVAGGQ
jgi:FixJ family two-component response regulator